MKNIRIASACLVVLPLGFVSSDRVQAQPPNAAGDLGSTSWQLVKFQGSDCKTLVPDDRKGGEIAKSQASNPHSPATTSLENKYWKLIRLGDLSVTAASWEREPHIVLNSESSRVTGSAGCKRLTGSYELKGDELKLSHTTGTMMLHGDELRLSHMTGTMMACIDGMNTEKAFLQALAEVNTWKIVGERLELFDLDGKLVATFRLVT